MAKSSDDITLVTVEGKDPRVLHTAHFRASHIVSKLAHSQLLAPARCGADVVNATWVLVGDVHTLQVLSVLGIEHHVAALNTSAGGGTDPVHGKGSDHAHGLGIVASDVCSHTDQFVCSVRAKRQATHPVDGVVLLSIEQVVVIIEDQVFLGLNAVEVSPALETSLSDLGGGVSVAQKAN